MENSLEAEGVFLYTKHLDTGLIVKCLQKLLNNFPDVKITSVKYDEKFFGYRVHFTCPEEDMVLAKKHLSVAGEDIRIVPLTTFLTLHNIKINGDEQFKKDVRETIENKFGKVLYTINVPISDHQNEYTKNLRACIDIPELKELEIFDHEGYPDMYVCLPNEKEKSKVTFHCKRCKKDGHTRQDCPNPMLPKGNITEELKYSDDSENFSAKNVKPFGIRLEHPDIYAEKIGREEILKTGILTEENQRVKDDGRNNSNSGAKGFKENNLISENLSFIKVKKETEEKENNSEKNISESLDAAGENCKLVTKDEPSNIALDNQDTNSNSIDDDIQVIGYRENSNSSNTRHSFTLKSENRDDAENSNDALSSPPRNSEQFSSSASFASPGPSRIHGMAKPVTAVEITKNLSPQLQACINNACKKFSILDRDKLDAFLIHVKKKSNPLRIASNYTSNAGQLKEQLQHIIKLFYNTPQAGTKDDTQFIKWLTGLVDRFEGTIPKKRKRSQYSDDSPNKK